MFIFGFSRNVLQHNHTHPDFPLPSEQLERYIPKCLIYALLWSFAGDAKLKVRSDLGDFIRSVTTIPLPPMTNVPVIDYEVSRLTDFIVLLSVSEKEKLQR